MFIVIGLIKWSHNPKPIYIFFFWVQLIVYLLVIIFAISYVFKLREERYSNRWGMKLLTWSVRLFVIVICSNISIYLIVPMAKDIPNLLLGTYDSVKGQPEKVWHYHKSFTEHVYIGGKDVEFFLESKMGEKENKQKYYYVEYLHYSKYAVNVNQIEK